MLNFKVINSEYKINGKTVPLIQSPSGEVYGVSGNDVVELGDTINAPILTDTIIGVIKGTRGTGETPMYKVIVELK